ncbi:MAG: hypothetical protein M3460_15475 [Actinomycetota bacterium]|nr:hypothetical protein [Actinomycetota bacterium]
MTTTTTTAMSFVQAAELLAAHLAKHALPEPVFLTVTTQWGHSEVAAQLRPDTVSEVAGELLAWIDTLAAITITAWRPPESERVHLSIVCTLTDPAGAVALTVYGAAKDHDPVRFANLKPGQRRGVSLSELRAWAAGKPTTTGSPVLDTPRAGR